MSTALNVLIALVPVALICAFVYLRDARQPEKPRHLLLTFVLGALFAVPAYFLEAYVDDLGYQDSLDPLVFTAYVFLGIALVEEVCKYAPVLLYPYRQAFFDEPLDGIVYCVFAAMGFALAEGIAYAPHITWDGALTRAALTIPAHGAFAMIAGYYLGRARGPQTTGARGGYVLQGLLWAVVAHGLYNWAILNPWADWVMLLGVVVLLASWGLALRLTAKHARGPEPTPLASGRV